MSGGVEKAGDGGSGDDDDEGGCGGGGGGDDGDGGCSISGRCWYPQSHTALTIDCLCSPRMQLDRQVWSENDYRRSRYRQPLNSHIRPPAEIQTGKNSFSSHLHARHGLYIYKFYEMNIDALG